MSNRKMQMPEELAMYQTHRHVTDAVARSALKAVADHLQDDYQKVVRKFVNQDYQVTVEFWNFLEKQCPDVYSNVDFCKGCNAFTLYKKSTNISEKKLNRTHSAVPLKGFLKF